MECNCTVESSWLLLQAPLVPSYALLDSMEQIQNSAKVEITPHILDETLQVVALHFCLG